MSKSPKINLAGKGQDGDRDSTLLPMLIGGLLLALVGMVIIVLFV